MVEFRKILYMESMMATTLTTKAMKVYSSPSVLIIVMILYFVYAPNSPIASFFLGIEFLMR